MVSCGVRHIRAPARESSTGFTLPFASAPVDREALLPSLKHSIRTRAYPDRTCIHMIVNGSTLRELTAMAMRHRIVIGLVLMTIVTTMAGCGGKDEDPGRAATAKPAAADGAQRADQAAAARDARRPANAVTTGEAGAALELQYELAPRPETGQAFTVQLAFVPQVPADSIDAQLSVTPGLRITSAESVRFADVLAGERYTTEVMIVGDLPGLYYIGVVARMATQVQTDARSFSVPVVVGAPAAAAKPPTDADASGSATVVVPPEETGGT
jgi:hypothetical protein